MLQEPDDNACEEDDRAGSLHEITRFFPHQHQYIPSLRKPVVRKFHHKRNGFSPQECRLVEEGDEDSCGNAQEIEPQHDDSTASGKECRTKEGIYRHFCRARHEGDKEDGKPAVALRRQCTGRHYRRHRTSEPDKHGHDATSRKSETPQQTVHNKGNACHIS